MLEDLSPREREVFDLLLEGLSQKEIAHKLNIGHSTLDYHRTKLYRKLGVHSIKELFAKYSTNGKMPPAEPETALLVPETKKNKRFKILLLARIALGIIILVLSALLIWKFVVSSKPKGVKIPVHNLGFHSWSDANGKSTSEVFITSEEIDGVKIDSVLNIKTNLVKPENNSTAFASAQTDKDDVILRLRKANGVRFKARGDGKSWTFAIYTKETTTENDYAHYRYIFGTVRDNVIVVDIPYSVLTIPEWWKQYYFDFNKKTIREMCFFADSFLQGYGSSLLQIFDFEVY